MASLLDVTELSSQQWLERIASHSDLDLLAKGLHGVRQEFLDSGDLSGLEIFFDQLLRQCLSAQEYIQLKLYDTAEYELGVEAALAEVAFKLSLQPKTKVLSYEYFFDSTGQFGVHDFYLLDEYNHHNATWYHRAKILDTVTGPSVTPYYQARVNTQQVLSEQGSKLEFVICHYIQAILLVRFVQTVELSEITLPCSFAAQDGWVNHWQPKSFEFY